MQRNWWEEPCSVLIWSGEHAALGSAYSDYSDRAYQQKVAPIYGGTKNIKKLFSSDHNSSTIYKN